MTGPNDKSTPTKPSQGTKPGLRLIKAEPHASDEAGRGAPTADVKAVRPKSNLGQFMTAFADAIDRDIKIILDL